jgi:hypothetical protein
MATVNRATVEALCGKLEKFAAGLSDEERAILKRMIEGEKLSDDALKQVTGGTFSVASAPRLTSASFHAAAGCW